MMTIGKRLKLNQWLIDEQEKDILVLRKENAELKAKLERRNLQLSNMSMALVDARKERDALQREIRVLRDMQ